MNLGFSDFFSGFHSYEMNDKLDLFSPILEKHMLENFSLTLDLLFLANLYSLVNLCLIIITKRIHMFYTKRWIVLYGKKSENYSSFEPWFVEVHFLCYSALQSRQHTFKCMLPNRVNLSYISTETVHVDAINKPDFCCNVDTDSELHSTRKELKFKWF